MGTKGLTVGLLAALSAWAPACLIERYHSVDGRFEMTRLARDGVFTAKGELMYPLPSGAFARNGFLSPDGQRVVLLFDWSLQALTQGKIVSETPVPPALAGQFRVGWVDSDGNAFLATGGGDLWKWIPGSPLKQVADPELPAVLADPDAEPAAVFLVALQHEIQLDVANVPTPAAGDYPSFRKACRAGYVAWQAGSSLPAVREAFRKSEKPEGTGLLAEWTACYPFPARLISDDEWRELESSLPTCNDLNEAAAMFAWASRRQDLSLLLSCKNKRPNSKPISLDSFLALGADREPQLLAQYLRTVGDYDYRYLNYLKLHPTSAAVPWLISEVNVPLSGYYVRQTLKSQLHVDLGASPGAWRNWLNKPARTASDRAERLLRDGDRSGLLWLPQSDHKPRSVVLPRLVAMKKTKGYVGAPWLKLPYFGVDSFSNPWWLDAEARAHEWCWSLKTGQPLAPIPTETRDVGVDPERRLVVLEDRDSDQKYVWKPDKDGAFGLSAIDDSAFREYAKGMDLGRSHWHEISQFSRRNKRFSFPFLRQEKGEETVWLDPKTKKPVGALAELNTWGANPDGSVLAVAVKDGLLLIEPKTAKVVHTIRGVADVQTLSFDNTGRYLAAGSYHEIWVFDLRPTLKLSNRLESELWTGMYLKNGEAEALTESEYWSRKATWESQTGRSWLEPRLAANASHLSKAETPCR